MVNTEIRYFKARTISLILQLASIVIDAIFLSIWVIIQYILDIYVISRLTLSGIDDWVLSIFQIVFALSTLVPVMASLYVDIRIILYRACQQHRDLQKSINRDHSDEC